MTDPQTPATEAGRRLLEETAGFDGDGLAPIDRPTWLAAILAIEAEARGMEHDRLAHVTWAAEETGPDGNARAEPVTWEIDSNGDEWGYLTREGLAAIQAEARGDALREAAERVRALGEYETNEPKHAQERAWNRCVQRVLAILDPS